MVTFAAFRDKMKELHDEDTSVESLEAEGATPDEALSKAATLFGGIPKRYLEYEVIERQQSFMGVGADHCKITVTIRSEYREKLAAEAATATTTSTESDLETLDVYRADGAFSIQVRRGKVFVKVTAPEGGGNPVEMAAAEHALAARSIAVFDKVKLKEAVRRAAGAYIEIGAIDYNPVNDTLVSVENRDDLYGLITVTPPKIGGSDWTAEEYIAFIKANGIIYGIKEDFIRDFADKPTYNRPVLVAEAEKAVDGLPSYMEYYFDVDQGVRLREVVGGKIDFKELNIIQNVLKDQALAKKIPAEQGVPGRSLSGTRLEAKDGKDIQMPQGKNTHVAGDGATLLADINGQVLMLNGKINVEPVFNVDGSVNLKTGNIVFLGTVIITGNVEEGFSVKASGNIEVRGMVDKADLEAEGNIVIKQGITGKKGNYIRAGGSVWAKFIENGAVNAGDMVIVSDGILNSQVDATKRIICNGKRATVIGGRLRAMEEIVAKQLGSNSGNTETVCEVGYDPSSKEKLNKLTSSARVLGTQLDEIQLNLQTLENLKRQRRGELPEDKEDFYHEMTAKRDELLSTIEATNGEIREIREVLINAKTTGRISASAKVNAGVVVTIRDAKETIHSPYKAITFIIEQGLVKAVPYQESKMLNAQAPDAEK